MFQFDTWKQWASFAVTLALLMFGRVILAHLTK